ncbi:MAG: hypothetical protein HPY71_05570 [Firmicutes bacterium]|nr:hypothetical protein [Bacillota bacterium]
MKGYEKDSITSIQAKLISKTEVLSDFVIDLDDNAQEALLGARVLTHGIENDRYFREYYDCTILAAKDGCDGQWLVGGVEFRKGTQVDPAKFPENRIIKYERNKLTLAMLVRNEADRYLCKVLRHAAQYIDSAVILDDASEDNTVQICKETLKGIPLTIVSNAQPGFANEIELRKQLWNLVVSTNPDWILVLDADEMLEDRAASTIRGLIDQPFYDHYSFRLYDFWDATHYREDLYWQAHKTYRVLLVRYQPDFVYTWRETPLHCGRLPNNLFLLPGTRTDLRVKHFGWATLEDRQIKYQRYVTLDPKGVYGILPQYESILDPQPNLIRWIE